METRAENKGNSYRVWLFWPPTGKATVDIEADSLEEAESEALETADDLIWDGVRSDWEIPEINDSVLLGPNGEYLSPLDDQWDRVEGE